MPGTVENTYGVVTNVTCLLRSERNSGRTLFMDSMNAL